MGSAFTILAQPSCRAILTLLASGERTVGAQRPIRQLHLWVSIAFTVIVIGNFIARAKRPPPAWITYSPLVPLAVLLPTGLHLFVLPYTVKRR
jgi:hypothetical protein